MVVVKGWQVIESSQGRDKPASRIFHSQAAANEFCAMLKRYRSGTQAWVREVMGAEGAKSARGRR